RSIKSDCLRLAEVERRRRRFGVRDEPSDLPRFPAASSCRRRTILGQLRQLDVAIERRCWRGARAGWRLAGPGPCRRELAWVLQVLPLAQGRVVLAQPVRLARAQFVLSRRGMRRLLPALRSRANFSSSAGFDGFAKEFATTESTITLRKSRFCVVAALPS